MAKDPASTETKENQKIQTPGTDPEPKQASDDAVLDAGVVDEVADSNPDEQAEMILDLQTANKDLAEEVKRLTRLLKAAGVQAGSAQEVKESELPDSKSVDPKKIKTQVLTKQGWVLPAEKPVE